MHPTSKDDLVVEESFALPSSLRDAMDRRESLSLDTCVRCARCRDLTSLSTCPNCSATRNKELGALMKKVPQCPFVVAAAAGGGVGVFCVECGHGIASWDCTACGTKNTVSHKTVVTARPRAAVQAEARANLMAMGVVAALLASFAGCMYLATQ